MKINRLTGLAALGLCACMAQEPKKEAKPKPANATGQSGMVIVRTPDGGLRAPTPEEHQALTGQGGLNVQVTAGAPQPQNLGAGKGLMLMLDPATTNVFSVATKGPDGKLTLHEAVGQKAADRLVNNPAPVSKPAAKEAAQ